MKRTYQPKRDRGAKYTDSESVWLPTREERFLKEEETRAESTFLRKRTLKEFFCRAKNSSVKNKSAVCAVSAAAGTFYEV